MKIIDLQVKALFSRINFVSRCHWLKKFLCAILLLDFKPLDRLLKHFRVLKGLHLFTWVVNQFMICFELILKRKYYKRKTVIIYCKREITTSFTFVWLFCTWSYLLECSDKRRCTKYLASLDTIMQYSWHKHA